MLGKLQDQEDTIVALATPSGIGALGLIRLSGCRALGIGSALLVSRDLAQMPSHTLYYATIREDEKLIDEVVVSIFKAPTSYTGEDVLEISCHGSPYIQNRILQLCVQKGARLARPGEFTQRAFIHGKLDLTQAEAVADLIACNTEASLQTALKNMRGGFSSDLKILREQLIRFSALVELELDFSQEDVEFADRRQFLDLVNAAQLKVNQLIASFKLGNVIKNGVNTVIAGKPNAGKSTLLNALLNENRAIVSEIAGTTRDTIEEVLNIGGILFRLVDTAGIRENSLDQIESIGVERTLEKVRLSDIVVLLTDVVEESKEEIQVQVKKFIDQQVNFILVGNKVDIIGLEAARKKFLGLEMLYISAKNHEYLDPLKEALVSKVMDGNLFSENTIVTNARHQSALLEVQQSLAEVKGGLDQNIPADLLSLDIRRCLHFIGEITGDITNEDRLDYIFSKFCIGK
ncbi:MAG: tRNA uridine-5-carboxymethylaminomethyl(34) synthesis GTPase MnmE [Chitinophagaceae bacterium]